MFIGYDNKSSFLRNTMNVTHPVTLFDMIDDTCIEKADDFLSYHFLHFRLEFPLKICNWLGSILLEYSMSGY
jgi:hypothetical protein